MKNSQNKKNGTGTQLHTSKTTVSMEQICPPSLNFLQTINIKIQSKH